MRREKKMAETNNRRECWKMMLDIVCSYDDQIMLDSAAQKDLINLNQ